MPYANNQGVNIYYEVEGDGSPLVLIMGLWEMVGIGRALVMRASWPMTTN